MRTRRAATPSRVFSVPRSGPVGEVQIQQALGEGPVGRRLIARRGVGTDGRRNAVHDTIVVGPEKERNRVARGAVAVEGDAASPGSGRSNSGPASLQC